MVCIDGSLGPRCLLGLFFSWLVILCAALPCSADSVSQAGVERAHFSCEFAPRKLSLGACYPLRNRSEHRRSREQDSSQEVFSCVLSFHGVFRTMFVHSSFASGWSLGRPSTWTDSIPGEGSLWIPGWEPLANISHPPFQVSLCKYKVEMAFPGRK